MAMQLYRAHAKSPIVISEILLTVRALEHKGKEPTFNGILEGLAEKRILAFHRSFRKYLDLLVLSKVLTVDYQRTAQQNIRQKQVYHTIAKKDEPVIEAGEKALLFHGLNWDIPSPMSLYVKTDMAALSRSGLSEGKVYAGLEDALIYSLRFLLKRRPSRSSELIVFATALLATQKIDYSYLINRASQEGVERLILGILFAIDWTLSSPNPRVEDIPTLYELRNRYANRRRSFLKKIKGIDPKIIARIPKEIVSPSEVVEYAGKQLGLRG
ncbi:MAG: hypothetical protein PXY39_02305 [archaeon]|nr:hypothetical protein [archaeon]